MRQRSTTVSCYLASEVVTSSSAPSHSFTASFDSKGTRSKHEQQELPSASEVHLWVSVETKCHAVTYQHLKTPVSFRTTSQV